MQTASGEGETGNEASRDEERGDVSEPDAPTSVEENVGMSTVLNPDPVTGVQENAEE